MADKAKKILTAAKSKFTRRTNRILTGMESGGSIESLSILFEDLNITWSQLEEKHNEYISLIEESEQDAGEEWISDVEETYLNNKLKFLGYKQRKETENAITCSLRIFKGAADDFLESCNRLEQSVSNESPVATIIRVQNIVHNRYEVVRKVHDNLVEKSNDNSHTKLIISCTQQFSHVNDIAERYTLELNTQEKKLKSIQVEKLPLPKFDGCVRSIPDLKEILWTLFYHRYPPCKLHSPCDSAYLQLYKTIWAPVKTV